MITTAHYSAEEMSEWLRKRQIASLVVAGVAAVATLAGLVFNSDQFFRSWLMSFLMCLGLSLGCLSLEMLQYLTGGKWGLSIERILEPPRTRSQWLPSSLSLSFSAFIAVSVGPSGGGRGR